MASVMMRQALPNRNTLMYPMYFSAPPRLRVSLILLAMASVSGATENWPQWRGPSGNGVSDSTGLPTNWNAETNENIVWKTPLPSWSGSTPIIWGDHIFVMSPSMQESSAQPQEAQPSDGKKAGGKGGRPRRDPGGQ